MTAGLVVRAFPTPLNAEGQACMTVLLLQQEPRRYSLEKVKGHRSSQVLVSGNWFKKSRGKLPGKKDKSHGASPGSIPLPHTHTKTPSAVTASLSEDPQKQPWMASCSHRIPRNSHGWPSSHTGSPGTATDGLTLTRDPQVQSQMASFSHRIPRNSHGLTLTQDLQATLHCLILIQEWFAKDGQDH